MNDTTLPHVTYPGRTAYRAALNLLLARHADEFKELHRSERLALGLPAESVGNESTKEILRKLENVRKKEEAYIQKLSARGVTP